MYYLIPVLTLATPSVLGQRATATVQLPIARTIGVATTVSVPDNGYGLIAANKRVIGHSAGRARMRQGEGEAFCVGVTIHNIEEVEQRNAWRVAYRLFETGRVAEAIERFDELAKQETSDSARTAAKSELAALCQIGAAAFDRAVELAKSGQPAEGSKMVDKILVDFDRLLTTPARRSLQKQLWQIPELAESREGRAANELYEKGLKANANHRPGVAKLFFQQAVAKRGTKAADKARVELAKMGVKVSQKDLITTHAFGAQGAKEPDTARRWLDLARLYRDVDPKRSNEFYRRALDEMPKDAPELTAIRKEAAAPRDG